MDGHLAVFHSQGSLAVVGFIDMEHAAVCLEGGSVGAVLDRGVPGLFCFVFGSLFRSLSSSCSGVQTIDCI